MCSWCFQAPTDQQGSFSILQKLCNSWKGALVLPDVQRSSNIFENASERLCFTKPYEFLWFGCIHTKQGHNNKTGYMSARHMNSCVLAAFTQNEATIIDRIRVTNPYEFLWFGCIHTNQGHNNKQDTCHQTIWIPMGYLHPHQNKATKINRIHATNPYEFLRFGCIHTKYGHNNE